MTFDESLKLALIESGLLAGTLATIAFLFDWLLQRSKARNDLETAVASERAKAYQRLWALTLNAAPGDDFSSRLTSWYYEDGNGMFLSHRSSTLYFLLRSAVRAGAAKGVDDACSALRTQLKYDCGMYSSSERRVPVKHDEPAASVALRDPFDHPPAPPPNG